MRRILVAEDSRTQAEHLRLILDAEGFDVQVAPDGQRGLELFHNSSFDLVISDVVMPGLSGYELCRRIKDHPVGRQVPVILLTSLNDPRDILQGIECGADNFVTKPYQPDALLGRIRYIFANQVRRGAGKVKVGIEVAFLGKTFTVTSEKEQILDLLISTCEDIVRVNQELRASQADLTAVKAEVERHNVQLVRARTELEERVRARTAELAEANAALRQEVEDRKRAERRLSAQHAVTSVLAESPGLGEAAPRVLRSVCESLGWAWGALWTVDAPAGVLRCTDTWSAPAAGLGRFEAVTRQVSLACGEGLPGRVWASGEPAWIPDVLAHEHFVSKAAAEGAGLRSVLASQVVWGGKVLGVLEFATRAVEEPDPELLETLTALGSQVGQFIERKQAEAAHDREREFLKAVLENTQEGIVACDTRGTLTFFNRAARAFHGQAVQPTSPEEWALRYDLYGPDGKTPLARDEVPLFRALRGECVRDVEIVISPEGGTVRTLWASGQAILGVAGETVGAVVVMHDVTERNRLERQLNMAQKMEAIGQLAGGVAHDFNNLLTIINGYSEVLLGRLRPDDSAYPLLGEIKKAGERAAGLTRQLLAFSRQQVIAPTVLDLNAVVAEVEKMLRRLIGEDVALACVLAPALGRVKADPGQVEQILLNLAVNARDAMPQGGKLTIETADVELDEDYACVHPGIRPGSFVLLAVRDTGCGMDEATRARIFEPFFTTKGPGQGTGLGLATVYGIVKQSGGSIYVESEPLRGTTFKIYLPRVEAAPQSEARPVRRLASGPSGTETLLLVEDEDAVRGLSRHILQLNGYTVLEARDGSEAIRLAERHEGPIHLLVSDVVMPEMGGRELADRLTALHPGLGVLYMSGYTDDAVVRHGVLAAEAAFLQKPFTIATLTHKVREVLDRRNPLPACTAVSAHLMAPPLRSPPRECLPGTSSHDPQCKAG